MLKLISILILTALTFGMSTLQPKYQRRVLVNDDFEQSRPTLQPGHLTRAENQLNPQTASSTPPNRVHQRNSMKDLLNNADLQASQQSVQMVTVRPAAGPTAAKSRVAKVSKPKAGQKVDNSNSTDKLKASASHWPHSYHSKYVLVPSHHDHHGHFGHHGHHGPHVHFDDHHSHHHSPIHHHHDGHVVLKHHHLHDHVGHHHVSHHGHHNHHHNLGHHHLVDHHHHHPKTVVVVKEPEYVVVDNHHHGHHGHHGVHYAA